MGNVEQVLDVRMHIDQHQVAAVGLSGNVSAKDAAETRAVDGIDAAQIGEQEFMLGR